MIVAGNLFIHSHTNRSVRSPAIITGHSMGAVKEQNAKLYATWPIIVDSREDDNFIPQKTH